MFLARQRSTPKPLRYTIYSFTHIKLGQATATRNIMCVKITHICLICD